MNGENHTTKTLGKLKTKSLQTQLDLPCCLTFLLCIPAVSSPTPQSNWSKPSLKTPSHLPLLGNTLSASKGKSRQLRMKFFISLHIDLHTHIYLYRSFPLSFPTSAKSPFSRPKQVPSRSFILETLRTPYI